MEKEQIWELLKVIEDKGGFLRCFLDRWVEDQITEKRHQMGEDLASNERPIVGVNIFSDDQDSTDINIFRHSEEWQHQRIREIQNYKKDRRQESVLRAVERLETQIRKSPEVNCLEGIMGAVEARATLGEIIDGIRRGIDFKRPGLK